MYRYADFKGYVLSEEGSRVVMETRDRAARLLTASGAATMSRLMPSGDSWKAMAVVDRLVEMGDLREVTIEDPERVFVARGALAQLVQAIRGGGG